MRNTVPILYPPLGFLASGEAVVDRFRSHCHNGVHQLLAEGLPQIHSDGRPFIVETLNFGRVVGNTTCVETSPQDTVVFGQRPKRLGLSRFVMNRQSDPCKSLIVILKAGDEGCYILITAFIGKQAQPEPWDQKATLESVRFWQTHALVWGSEEVLCASCGLPKPVHIVGDIALCNDCHDVDAEKIMLIQHDFPGWSELRVPARFLLFPRIRGFEYRTRR